MTADTDLAQLARLCGIHPEFRDMQGQTRVTGPETQRALLSALHQPADTDAAVTDSLKRLKAAGAAQLFPAEVIIESDTPHQLDFGTDGSWALGRDGTEEASVSGPATPRITLPPLSPDVYLLSVSTARGTQTVRILAAPRRLASIEDLTGQRHLWGINLALYGLRSDRNSGLGDYADLGAMAALAGHVGAGFVGVNPIHNMGFADSSISPYSPSHRGFLNTAHIALDQIAGLEHAPSAQHILTKAAPAFADLRATDQVAYAPHRDTHSRVLRDLYGVFLSEAYDAAKADLNSFAQDGGEALLTFATYEALSEEHGPDWRDWPVQNPQTANTDDCAFHIWLQWVADRQLRAVQAQASRDTLPLGLYLDLAVGPRRGGAESWCAQGVVARGVSVGAPPDHLSPEGQNWNLSAFAPDALPRANYRPLRQVLAQVMRHAGVVRIDHVLGLARSFLIPDCGAPGAYVTQPLAALIAVIKIEAARHRCAVIGEDLGLVPDGFRDEMRGHGFYGYSVLQYEKDAAGRFKDPASAPAQVLSCFATHDTPTLKGYESAADIDWWHQLGWIAQDEVEAAKAARAQDVAALRQMAGTKAGFASSIHALLAASPASMISVQLDDILGIAQAQNLPGTIDAHPNWRRKSPIDLAALARTPALRDLGQVMAHARPTQEKEPAHDSPHR